MKEECHEMRPSLSLSRNWVNYPSDTLTCSDEPSYGFSTLSILKFAISRLQSSTLVSKLANLNYHFLPKVGSSCRIVHGFSFSLENEVRFCVVELSASKRPWRPWEQLRHHFLLSVTSSFKDLNLFVAFQYEASLCGFKSFPRKSF